MKKITLLFLLVMTTFFSCTESDPALEYNEALGDYEEKADSTVSALASVAASTNQLTRNPAEIMSLTADEFRNFIQLYSSEWRVVQDNIEMANGELELVNQKAQDLFTAREEATKKMLNDGLREAEIVRIEIKKERFAQFYDKSKAEIDKMRREVALGNDYVIIMENAQALREIESTIPSIEAVSSKLNTYSQTLKDLTNIGKGIADFND